MADNNPKISINKLGEYLEANPSRRRRIVFDQKNPVAFITTRYNKAREIAVEYFSSNFDEEIILGGIEDIDRDKNSTDFQANDNQKSMEYLERLLDIDLPNFDNLTISKYIGDNPKVNLNGLEVSVNPDLIVRGILRGKKVVGAIKLHISQSNSLNDESAKNVATILHLFVEQFIAEDDELADIRLCYSIDIFSETIESAPRSFFRRRNYISDACLEIIMWWNNL